jgi:hypothetical protein
MTNYNDITLDIDEEGIWLIDNTDEGDMQMGHVSWRQVAIHVQKELTELKEDDADAQFIPALKEAQERTKGLLTEADADREMSKHFVEMADRIEGLEELLWAAENDAKEAEAYVEELEAKLAKAVLFLDELRNEQCYDGYVLVELIKELTGGKDD